MESKYKAIIFDFDGVICETNDIKTEAFRKLFCDYPEYVDRIVNYHKENGGLSRYRKFEYIYKEILKKELIQERSKELGERFSQYVYDGVIMAPFVEGAYEFLEKYYHEILLFVASGTPQDEMTQIVKSRELERFFKGVYGSPAIKSEIINRILKEYALDAVEVVFVGDSINDYDGAREAGIEMIGRVCGQHPDPFVDLELKGIVKNITDLEVFFKNEGINGERL